MSRFVAVKRRSSEGFRRLERARDDVVRWAYRDRRLLAGGLMALALYFVAAAGGPPRHWRASLAQVGRMLEGRSTLGDAATDVVGLRRLVEGRDPYPVLGPALREIGVEWQVTHPSTRPPTGYLLAAPVAYLPLPAAARVLAIIGFALLFCTFLCYGVRAGASLGLALLAGVWRPVALSFEQVTLVWMAGVALAYRYRERSGTASGCALGIASLSKFFPLAVLGHFLFRRKYAALLGALLVWSVAAALVVSLNHEAFARYVEVNRTNTWQIILRTDNGSIFRQAYRFGGWSGLVAVVTWVAALLVRNRIALVRPAQQSEYAFFLYSFLAVALLPISWEYSVAPLLPVIGYFFLRGRGFHILVAAGAFALPQLAGALGSGAVAVVVGLVSLLFWPAAPESTSEPELPGSEPTSSIPRDRSTGRAARDSAAS